MYHRGIPANDKPVELKTLLSLFWERPVIFQFHQIEDVNEGTQYFTCQGSDIALKGGNIMKSTFEEAKEYCLSQKSTAGFKKKVVSKTIFFQNWNHLKIKTWYSTEEIIQLSDWLLAFEGAFEYNFIR